MLMLNIGTTHRLASALLQYFLLLMVCIVIFSPACRSQEGSDNCDYFYVLQPPSELPCNPFHRLTKLGKDRIANVVLKCIIAQKNTSGEMSNDNATIRWIRMSGDSEPQCEKPTRDPLKNMVDTFFLFRSELKVTKRSLSNGNDSYWCELSTGNHDEGMPCNSSNRFANKLTIHESEFYDTLPPCPEDISFHLAERVCVTEFTGTTPQDCQPNSDCDGESEDAPVVIIVTAIAGALILLAFAIVIVVCVLRRRAKRQGKRKHTRKMKPENTSVAATVPPVREQEQILAPPTSAPPIFREENGAGMSARQLQLATPSPVIPQRPSKIFPPPHVKPLKVPDSARKRAISLLRRSSKGGNNKVTHDSSTEHAETNTGTYANEQRSVPKKKPYKTLEVDKVEVPHLYMTRAKSPQQTNRKQPPMPLKKYHQHQSREKLILTETMSSGYINPGEVEAVQQQMYKGIDPITQDYLAVYTVPRHQNDSSSEDEQPPIYEEPRQFD